MADGWDDGWAEPPTPSPSRNESRPTTNPSRARVGPNLICNLPILLKALDLGERRRQEMPNDIKTPILLPIGMNCPRMGRTRLEWFHHFQGIMPMAELIESTFPATDQPAPLSDDCIPSIDGRAGGVRPMHPDRSLQIQRAGRGAVGPSRLGDRVEPATAAPTSDNGNSSI